MDVESFIDLVVNIQTEENRRYWTEQENNLLRSLHGRLTDQKIGELLGRTGVAVELHWKRDLHLPSPTKDPNYISARKIAIILGIDNHVTPSWIDRGIMPGEYIARIDNRLHRRVRLDILFNWLENPINWIWFDIHKVRDLDIRSMLEQKENIWGDEWWNTNKVATYHHVDNKDVLRYIKSGRIKAIQAHNRSGRNKDYWANWFVLRSEATRDDLKFIHNKRTLRKD